MAHQRFQNNIFNLGQKSPLRAAFAVLQYSYIQFQLVFSMIVTEAFSMNASHASAAHIDLLGDLQSTDDVSGTFVGILSCPVMLPSHIFTFHRRCVA